MANIKSAIKSIRQDAKRTARNKPVRTSLKTYVKSAVTQIHTANTEQESSTEAVRLACSNLDKAARKGIIHPNQAARRKSRLMDKYNARFAPKPAETETVTA